MLRFVPVLPQKHRGHTLVSRRAQMPHRVAFRRLDLHDIRAEISQYLGGDRTEDRCRDVDNPYPGQGAVIFDMRLLVHCHVR